MAYTSTSSTNNGRLFENRDCKCGKKKWPLRLEKNDSERNNEALQKFERRLERLEANAEAMKLLSMATVVCTSFSFLMVLICLMLKCML
ncbi:unnamed protein product [Camellia sinensis]